MSKANEDSAVTVNEYRQALGLEPLEGVGVFRVPTGPGTCPFAKHLADAVPPVAPAVAPAASAQPALPTASAPSAPSQQVADAQDGQAQKQRTASPFRSMKRRELGEYLLRSLVEHTEPLEEPFKPRCVPFHNPATPQLLLERRQVVRAQDQRDHLERPEAVAIDEPFRCGAVEAGCPATKGNVLTGQRSPLVRVLYNQTDTL